MKLLRVFLLLVLAADILILVLFWPVIRLTRQRLDDRVGLIPKADKLQYNRYLDRVHSESGIDIRIVLAPAAAALLRSSSRWPRCETSESAARLVPAAC